MKYHTLDVMSDNSERVPYSDPEHPILACIGQMSAYRDMKSACHWHDDLEFGQVVSGHLMYSVNGDVFPLETGQGIFINARQLHNNFSADGTDCQYVCVLIHPSLLCGDKYLAERCVEPITGNAAFTHALLSPDVPWHADLMRSFSAMLELYGEGDPAFALTQQSMAYHIASLLLTHMPDPGGSARVDPRLSALRDMVGFVQRHYGEKITLAQIARAGSASESTCYALFRRHLRQTPGGYLTRYRLEKSMDLLRQPGLSVTEVALAVGFSSPSYYAESFRKHMGLTPTAYRGGGADVNKQTP